MPEPDILYENADLLVLNKPTGLVVHADKLETDHGFYLTDWLLKHYPEIRGVGESEERSGIVHRLDKDTSGVIIVAKTPAAYAYLKKQFKDRLVKKIYLALLIGELKTAVGEERTISWPIGRSSRDPRRRVASPKAVGKLRPAETKFRVVEHFPHYTLVEAEPLTGRTHQLRAHFKAYQHPIACDELYGTGNLCPAGLSRQALHALRLSLTMPDNSKETFSAPVPADLNLALEHLRDSC